MVRMRAKSKILLGLSFLMLIGVTSCKTTDLRTPTSIEQNDATKARQLLAEMGKAHGIEKWNAVKTYNVAFEDEFYGFMGKSSNPFKDPKVSFKLQYQTSTPNGNLEFLTGKATGEIWGKKAEQMYKKKAGKAAAFKKSKDVEFWLPTYQYFIEFPKQIQYASVVNYAGEMTIDGVACEGVIASWNEIAPQKDVDQYLIWMDKNTKRIVRVEYTIREYYKFISGAADFKDYKTFDGILFPGRMPVTSNLVKKGLLHEMRILDFKANVKAVEQLHTVEGLH